MCGVCPFELLPRLNERENSASGSETSSLMSFVQRLVVSQLCYRRSPFLFPLHCLRLHGDTALHFLQFTFQNGFTLIRTDRLDSFKLDCELNLFFFKRIDLHKLSKRL